MLTIERNFENVDYLLLTGNVRFQLRYRSIPIPYIKHIFNASPCFIRPIVYFQKKFIFGTYRLTLIKSINQTTTKKKVFFKTDKIYWQHGFFWNLKSLWIKQISFDVSFNYYNSSLLTRNDVNKKKVFQICFKTV